MARRSPGRRRLHAYHCPSARDGWLGLFGTAGLWVFVFIALTSLFPWGDARDSQMTLRRATPWKTYVRKIIAAGGLTAFAAGFSQTAYRMGTRCWVGCSTEPSTVTRRHPEFKVDTLAANWRSTRTSRVSYTPRLHHPVRRAGAIDKRTGKVLRVSGNPTNPLSANPELPQGVSVRELRRPFALRRQGLDGRATACVAGQRGDQPDRFAISRTAAR